MLIKPNLSNIVLIKPNPSSVRIVGGIIQVLIKPNPLNFC